MTAFHVCLFARFVMLGLGAMLLAGCAGELGAPAHLLEPATHKGEISAVARNRAAMIGHESDEQIRDRTPRHATRRDSVFARHAEGRATAAERGGDERVSIVRTVGRDP
jgi:3-oxoacyl-ACP reductase-like protein